MMPFIGSDFVVGVLGNMRCACGGMRKVLMECLY